ncbi:MAG: DUF4294 domain-containing protein [Bacteroidales bacterium]|nr:DUF4294 domain-containing protein [Bacteroidales bacterium]
MKPRVCPVWLWVLWTVGVLSGAETRLAAACIYDTDTAAVSDEAYRFLSEVEIHAAGLTPAELQAYYQTRYRVQKVYPYARMAGERFRLYEDSLAKLPRARDRKAFLRAAEAEIRRDFLSDLKNLTVSQGKVLFKLISRETGHSSYALLKEFKNGFSAFTYQVVGSTFGYNLKKAYDPTGEDLLIESIVQQIESGKLHAIPPPVRPAIAPPEPKRKAAAKRKGGR